MTHFRALIAVLLAIGLSSSAFAQNVTLPIREGARPETTNGVPHVQLGIEADKRLTDELLRRVSLFPKVNLGPTRVSLPGAVGFQLDRDMTLERPNAIVGGREFAHMHPDGSLHASLSPERARAAIMAGWAIAHPWASQRDGWEGFVMIYTPLTDAELDVVFTFVQDSYTYVTGQTLQ